MDRVNPFVVFPTNIEGPKKVKLEPSSAINQVDEKARLKHYFKINKDLWPLIEHNRHVRYRTLDNVLHIGGNIEKANDESFDAATGANRSFLRLWFKGRSSIDRRISWNIPYDDISEIYVKGNAIEITTYIKISQSIEELRELISKIARKLE